MSILIAWVVIGLTFFFGIAMDHQGWTKHDVRLFWPCLIVVVLLWPFGLIHRAWRDFSTRRAIVRAAAIGESK